MTELVPIAADLLRRLDAGYAGCRDAGRAFRTPHLLVVLLDRPDGPAAAAFDDVGPGLAAAVLGQLRAYLDRAAGGRFTPFEWSERADVRLAQQFAHERLAVAVDDAHLLLGVLDAGSNTIQDLASSLGDTFTRLRAAAVRHAF